MCALVFDLEAQNEGLDFYWQNDDWVSVKKANAHDIAMDEDEALYHQESQETPESWSLQDSLRTQFRIRKFRKSWRSDYKDKVFDYSQKKKTKREEVSTNLPNAPNPIFLDLYKLIAVIAKIIGYALIVLVVFLVVRAVFTDSGISISGFGTKKRDYEILDNDSEKIEEDWFLKAQESKKRQDYKMAIRYYFLAYLKQLHIEKHIEFHKDKSNREYRYEIADQNVQYEFELLSRVFDYCWYGDFAVDEPQFSRAEELFFKHLKR